jgi:hypothetical protein
MKTCPLCGQKLWKTENGLGNHVWHDHPESKICMGHGKPSIKWGDPAAARCSRSIMALCALRIARLSSAIASPLRCSTVKNEANRNTVREHINCEDAAYPYGNAKSI